MLRFSDASVQSFDWAQLRPMAQVYELTCADGVMARFDARGFLLTQQASAETAGQRLRFRYTAHETLVYDDDNVVARGLNSPNRIEFPSGPAYDFVASASGAGAFWIKDGKDRMVLHFERREGSTWRSRISLEPDANVIPEVPVLACWVCWLRVTGSADLSPGSRFL